MRFDCTLMKGKSFRLSGTQAMPDLTRCTVDQWSMGLPSISMEPERGCTNPVTALRMVLLPAPFAPITATIVPSSWARSTSLTAIAEP